MTRVRVARLALSTDAALLDALAARADAAERERAARFVRIEDQARHLLGRALARRLLARRLDRPDSTLRLVVDARGKPILDATDAPGFNVSHSGGWIVCAIADGVPVGVDVEQRVARMAHPDEFGPVFSPRERAAIDAAGDPAARIAAFAHAWARKEALLKAVGIGLLTKLDAIDIGDGPDGPVWTTPADPRTAATLSGAWTLRDVPVDDGHACAVAWGAAGGVVEVVDVAAASLAG